MLIRLVTSTVEPQVTELVLDVLVVYMKLIVGFGRHPHFFIFDNIYFHSNALRSLRSNINAFLHTHRPCRQEYRIGYDFC